MYIAVEYRWHNIVGCSIWDKKKVCHRTLLDNGFQYHKQYGIYTRKDENCPTTYKIEKAVKNRL